MTGTGYAFRDTDAAATRLNLLASVWAPASEPFVAACAPRDVELAYDLGCGPGWTTRLLVEAAGPRQTVGLDESESFIAKARRLHPEPEFEVWNVLQAGFPRGAAGLIYARMLLTHLPDPVAALRLWAGELHPGGALLVDEVEAIATEDPIFSRYLAIAAELIAQRSGRLYIGPLLASSVVRELRRIESRATELSPDPRQVAQLFGMNLRVWRDSPDVPASTAELDEIAAGLHRRCTEGVAPITWTMRQIAYRRP